MCRACFQDFEDSFEDLFEGFRFYFQLKYEKKDGDGDLKQIIALYLSLFIEKAPGNYSLPDDMRGFVRYVWRNRKKLSIN